MQTLFPTRFVPVVLVTSVVTFAMSLVLYWTLAEPVVYHWSAAGEPNRSGGRGELLLIGLSVLLVWLFIALATRPSRVGRFDRETAALGTAPFALVPALALLHIGAVNLGFGLPVGVVLLFAVGVVLWNLAIVAVVARQRRHKPDADSVFDAAPVIATGTVRLVPAAAVVLGVLCLLLPLGA